MSDYEVIFGLDCVGGDQAPIDCAVVKTSDGKPGLMLDGEVFTKESLTPEPAWETKIPVTVVGTVEGRVEAILPEGSAIAMTAPNGYYGIGLYDSGAVITIADGFQIEGGTCYFADGTTETIPVTTGSYTIPENASAIFVFTTR